MSNINASICKPLSPLHERIALQMENYIEGVIPPPSLHHFYSTFNNKSEPTSFGCFKPVFFYCSNIKGDLLLTQENETFGVNLSAQLLFQECSFLSWEEIFDACIQTTILTPKEIAAKACLPDKGKLQSVNKLEKKVGSENGSPRIHPTKDPVAPPPLPSLENNSPSERDDNRPAVS